MPDKTDNDPLDSLAIELMEAASTGQEIAQPLINRMLLRYLVTSRKRDAEVVKTLESIQTSVKMLNAQVESENASQRIDELERTQNKYLGALACATFIIPVVVTIVLHFVQ